MKTTIARCMFLAVLFAGSAFSQQSDQQANGQQTAYQADEGAAVPANDQANQSENQNPTSSKKHKEHKKKEKKKKEKKSDEDSISPPDNLTSFSKLLYYMPPDGRSGIGEMIRSFRAAPARPATLQFLCATRSVCVSQT